MIPTQEQIEQVMEFAELEPSNEEMLYFFYKGIGETPEYLFSNMNFLTDIRKKMINEVGIKETHIYYFETGIRIWDSSSDGRLFHGTGEELPEAYLNSVITYLDSKLLKVKS